MKKISRKFTNNVLSSFLIRRIARVKYFCKSIMRKTRSWFSHEWSTKQGRMRIIAVGFLVLCTGAFITYLAIRLTEPKAFSQQLKLINTLEGNVRDVVKSSYPREHATYAQSNQAYLYSVEKLLDPCIKSKLLAQKFNEKFEPNEAFEAASNNMAEFCDDLTTVRNYQRYLYDSLAPILAIEDRKSYAPQDVIVYSREIRQNFEMMQDGKINDAGRFEMVELLKEFERMEENNNNTSLSYDQFRQLQHNLLTHRITFWNNLVRVEALYHALEGLRRDLCAEADKKGYTLSGC